VTNRILEQQEDTHFRVLRLLQDNPKLTQRELAQELGVSLGAVNFCLKALLEKGAIKIQNFHNSKRKLAYAYLLTPKGIAQKAAITARFLQRKMAEYERLKAEIEALQHEDRSVKSTGIQRESRP
jgi:EPS-associated MarR family transcriptional regulator